jgi:hypothetical protein
MLSTTAPLLCTSDISIANQDKFLTIIEGISSDTQLIGEFQTMYRAQLEMVEKVDAFKRSLNDIINEIKISSTMNGSCSACPHNI